MKIEHQPDSSRFVATVEGGTANLGYATPREGVIDLLHTYVPGEARGEGVGEALVAHAFEHARGNRLRVVPTCPFVRAWLEGHPEQRDLLS